MLTILVPTESDSKVHKLCHEIQYTMQKVTFCMAAKCGNTFMQEACFVSRLLSYLYFSYRLTEFYSPSKPVHHQGLSARQLDIKHNGRSLRKPRPQADDTRACSLAPHHDTTSIAFAGSRSELLLRVFDNSIPLSTPPQLCASKTLLENSL